LRDRNGDIARGLTSRGHQTIAACEAEAHQLTRIGVSAVVDDYCLPELAR